MNRLLLAVITAGLLVLAAACADDESATPDGPDDAGTTDPADADDDPADTDPPADDSDADADATDDPGDDMADATDDDDAADADADGTDSDATDGDEADGDDGDDAPDAEGALALLGTAEDLDVEPRPERALISTASELNVIDATSGEIVRTLDTLPADQPEAPVSFAGAVVVGSDDDLRVVVDICCEPAAGALSRIDWTEPRGEGERESFATGYNPSADGDGRIAAIELTWLRVLSPEGEPLGQLPDNEAASEEGAPSASGVPAWSGDASLIAVEYATGPAGEDGPQTRIHLVEVGANGELRDAGPIEGSDAWVSPAFLADGTLVAAAPEASNPEGTEGTSVLQRVAADGTTELATLDGIVSDLRPDASHTNLIATLADGRVQVVGADGSVEDLTDAAISASWAPPGAG